MQLTEDHLRPRNSGSTDEPDNLVAACHSCNSVTRRMTPPPTATREDILAKKRARVCERRAVSYEHWLKTVAPRFLDRPLAGV